MHRLVRVIMVLLGLLIAYSASAADQKLISAEVMFRKPEKAAFQISREGNYLAWLAPWKKRMNVFIRDLKTGKEKRLTSETARDIGGYYFINEDVIAFSLDKGGDENFRLYGVNIQTGKEQCYTPFDGVRTYIVDDLEDDPEHVLIAMNKRDKRVMDVYRLTLADGKLEEVAQNDGTIVGWLTDHDGKLRGAFSKLNNRDYIMLRPDEKSEFKPFYLAPEGDRMSPEMFDFDNQHLIVSTNVNRDKVAYVKLSPGGNEVETLFEHPEVDAGAMIASREFKKIQGFGYVTDKLYHKIIDPELDRIITSVKARFNGQSVSFQDADKLQNKMLFLVYSDINPGEYYLYEKATDKLTLLVKARPWIKEKLLSSCKPVKFTSRDGKTQLNAYLTLPRDFVKPLGAIINPHGGPAVRDHWGFNPEVQYLANRGYAVLQINYRGSTGYGKAFQDLGIRQWGRGYMQHDLSDGAQWLIDQGIVPADRVAIYGASYGGYASLAGMTFTPELYACGISNVGPSSLLTLLRSIPPYWEPLKRDLFRRVGDPDKDEEFLKNISPLFFVDQIRKPLMVVQGANDPRVKKQESEQIVAAMKEKKIPVYYLLKENEGHGFHNEENQIEFYKYLEAFFARYLGGRTITPQEVVDRLKH
ncbi:MAG: S9 family peptidase [Candidatus Rifleibacteriota bacterium]